MTMHRLLNVLLACVLLAPCAARAQATRAADSRVRLNTVGFLPEYPKRASVPAKFKDFAVVEEGRRPRVVFRGRARGPVHNDDTDEDLYVADFSALTRPGTYRLEVEGVGSSPPFRVAANVYDAPFRAAVRAMYLWRCGAAVKATRGGVTYAHAACHTEDAWLDYVGGGHTRRDASGGWHDAGDYNKYVSNAGVTVGLMRGRRRARASTSRTSRGARAASSARSSTLTGAGPT
jgi:endoglucanase